jgi:hypothetical protein
VTRQNNRLFLAAVVKTPRNLHAMVVDRTMSESAGVPASDACFSLAKQARRRRLLVKLAGRPGREPATVWPRRLLRRPSVIRDAHMGSWDFNSEASTAPDSRATGDANLPGRSRRSGRGSPGMAHVGAARSFAAGRR